MKIRDNVYMVTFKNGNVVEHRAMLMHLCDGMIYELARFLPFDNGILRVYDGSEIESIVRIERNTDREEDLNAEI